MLSYINLFNSSPYVIPPIEINVNFKSYDEKLNNT